MKTRHLLIGVGILGAGAVVFSAGLVMGYLAAFGDVLGRDAPSSAAYTVNTLQQLRSGNAAEAISSLELSLDADLMERWSYDRSHHFVSSMLWPSGLADQRLMAFAARYRLEHPTEHPTEEVKAAISEVVNRYAKQKKP
jgi:hypothetical protein